MHPMYINLYVFFYISLCIYVINKYIMFHGIYEYMTLTIYKMYINYASMHPMHLKSIIIPMVSY